MNFLWIDRMHTIIVRNNHSFKRFFIFVIRVMSEINNNVKTSVSIVVSTLIDICSITV